MARCGGATCVCKFSADTDTHVTVSGSGSQTDPFVISLDVELTVDDGAGVDLSLGGSGVAGDPWVISASLDKSHLNDLVDINAAAPTNGQVLGWNAAAGKWQPQAATTAAAGSVLTANGLTGNGSAGSPLDVRVSPGRALSVAADGVGLDTESMGGLVRRFTDATARTNAIPTPDLNQLSALDANAGQPDFWDGTTWQPLMQVEDHLNLGGAFLQLSGQYDGRPVTLVTKVLNVTTDGTGSFDVLTATDLTGFRGVAAAVVQPTGALAWIAQVVNGGSRVSGIAYRTDGTGVYANQTLTATAFAVVY